jgi:hypothetical protein
VDREGDLTLASLDSAGNAADLEAQARRQIAEMGGDIPQPGSRTEGADASNSIWVTIDTEGRVESIEVSRNWRDRLDAGAFAGALLGAYNNAQGKSVQARAVKAFTAMSEGRSRHEGRATPVDLGPSPHDDPERWLAETMEAISSLTAQVQAINRGEAVQEIVGESVVRSPNELLTLRHQGRQISEITGEVMQIRRTDPESLRLEALDLFRAAGLTADAAGAGEARPAPAAAKSYEDDDYDSYGGGYSWGPG